MVRQLQLGGDEGLQRPGAQSMRKELDHEFPSNSIYELFGNPACRGAG